MTLKTKDRIFTYTLHKTFEQAAVGSEIPEPWDSWTPEEDCEVVGVQISGMLETISQNDCQTGGWVHVSQSGMIEQLSSVLSRVQFSGIWNTSPAAVQKEYFNNTVMFPKDRVVTVDEGDTVYLTGSVRSCSAGLHIYSINAIIYYIPRGRRR